MDRITLAGLQFYTHIGCTEEERKVGQYLELDLDMYVDLRAASEHDTISESVDYALVYRTVKDAIAGREAHLLETIAAEAAKAVRAAYPVERVRVRVRKPQPPMPFGRAAYAEVELER